MKAPFFYHKKPLLGLDVGSQTVKFMQLNILKGEALVKAYGNISVSGAIQEGGVIKNLPHAAEQVDLLLTKHVVGTLSTNRVAMSIPVSHVFTRVLSLPVMSSKELTDAIKLEVEQSVPMPMQELYYSYEAMDVAGSEDMLVRMVAAPRAIIDSYEALCELVGLDLCLIQTNIGADAQLCTFTENIGNNNPFIIVDVGSSSIDIGIRDEVLRITGTVEKGGNSLTEVISSKLGISHREAHELKVSQGIHAGKQQQQILEAVAPILDKVVAEIQKLIRFYQDRVKKDVAVSQILVVGGGANMPGFGDYLTNAVHMPTRVVSPWGNGINFGSLSTPEGADLPRFLTCAGLALADTQEAIGL